MKAPANKPTIEPIAAGTYNATCYGVVDVGTHLKKSAMYGDKEERQLRLMWEIPSLRITYEKDGKEVEAPKATGKTYKFSTYKKAKLAEHLTSWGYSDLDNLDFGALIGKSCMINIAQGEGDDGPYSYVNTVMAMPAGTPDMPLENPSIYYSIEDDKLNIPAHMTDHWIGKIKESPEFKALTETPQQQRQPQYDQNSGHVAGQDESPPFNPTDGIPF